MKRRVTVKSENGVTITAMIVAVILLIILTAVSITAVRSSERDVFETAYDAKTGMEVSTYQEELDIIDVQCASEQLSNGLSAAEYITLFKEAMAEDSIFDNAIIEDRSSTCIRIQTEEGYVFIVTQADGVEYAGVDGETDETYAITDDDVTFTYSPSDWTNEAVTVTISFNFDIGDDTFQYSIDGKETWEDYTGSFEVTANGKIYVMYETYGDDCVVGEVTNIDKLTPEEFSYSNVSDYNVKITDYTTNTITIAGKTEDQEATDEDGCSGMDHYEFGVMKITDIDESLTEDDMESYYEGLTEDELEEFYESITWYTTDSATSSDTSYTFTKLEDETAYTALIKGVDKAGNYTVAHLEQTTEKVPGGNDIVEDENENDITVITFNYSDNYTTETDVWTTEDVTVEIQVNGSVADDVEDGTYIIQYSEDGETWWTYEEILTFDANVETLYARLYDGNNGGEAATTTITCIDQVAPTTPTLEAGTVTETTITVSADSEDETSGIASYYFYIREYNQTYDSSEDDDDNEELELSDSISGYTTTSDSYRFTGLTSGESYIIRVVVTDNAGNVSEKSAKMKISAGEIVDLYYDYDSDWEIGDYVNYSIDLNENDDTTDDWRIFYEDDDGNIFLIATEYLPVSSKYIDTEELLVAYTSGTYGFSWWNVASDSDQMAATAEIQSSLDSNVLDLFMNYWPNLTSSTNVTARAISVMMYTDLWDGLVDETYADYAIGCVTFEMWEAAWETQGYEKIYYDSTKSTYGYRLSLDENSYADNIIINFNAMEDSGYDDDLFFPSDYADHIFASPSGSAASRFIKLNNSGEISYQSNNRNVDSAGNISYTTGYLKPVVMLSSETYLVKDTLGIVQLYDSNPEINTANMKLYYEPTTWTNESASVYVEITDEDINNKVANGVYVFQYIEESEEADPDNDDDWITCTSTNLELTVTQNETIYVRLFDGTRASENYATTKINIIDTLAPNDIEDMEATAVLETIVVTGTATDADATETDGCSGIDHYEYKVTNQETNETETFKSDYAVTSYVISDDSFLLYGNYYTVEMTAYDEAGNASNVAKIEDVYLASQAETGDWVDYGVNLNGNKDSEGDEITTDDWRLFYVTDDATIEYDTTDTSRMTKITTTGSGQVFIIAADYVKYNAEDEEGNWLINYDTSTSTSGTGLSYLIGKNYVLYWLSVPTKQLTTSMFSYADDDETEIAGTNKLFMAEWANYYNSSTSNYNIRAVLTLLNTDNRTNFVDNTYAEYAIGSPTMEMWLEAWNGKGYKTVYYEEGTYGYLVGTSSTLTTSSFSASVSSDTTGYNDTIFFPHKTSTGSDGTSINGYWLASPSANNTDALMCVSYYGSLNNYSYYYAYCGLRPLVSLKSGVTMSYNAETGIWTFSEE